MVTGKIPYELLVLMLWPVLMVVGLVFAFSGHVSFGTGAVLVGAVGAVCWTSWQRHRRGRRSPS